MKEDQETDTKRLSKDEQTRLLAFRKWHMHYVPRDVDLKSERCDWLRACRKGLLLTTKAVADKLNIKPQSYWEMEERERSGAITLKDLKRAADVMDCEVVYSIRHKSGKSFAQVIWEKLIGRAAETQRVQEARQFEPAWAGRVLASEAIKLFRAAKFRKEMGWSYQKTTLYNHKRKRTKPPTQWWPTTNPRSRGR